MSASATQGDHNYRTCSIARYLGNIWAPCRRWGKYDALRNSYFTVAYESLRHLRRRDRENGSHGNDSWTERHIDKDKLTMPGPGCSFTEPIYPEDIDLPADFECIVWFAFVPVIETSFKFLDRDRRSTTSINDFSKHLLYPLAFSLERTPGWPRCLSTGSLELDTSRGAASPNTFRSPSSWLIALLF